MNINGNVNILFSSEQQVFGSDEAWPLSDAESANTARGDVLTLVGGTKFKFYCDICGKGFSHHGSVRQHRTIHLGTTKCPVCNGVFSRVSNLKRHILQQHSSHYVDQC